MEWISSPESWIALLTLTALEIVLGIDNIIFISILAGKLPRKPAENWTAGWPADGYDHQDPALILDCLVDPPDYTVLQQYFHMTSLAVI